MYEGACRARHRAETSSAVAPKDLYELTLPTRRFLHPVLIPAVVLGAAVSTPVSFEPPPGRCTAAPPTAAIFAATLTDSATVYRGTFSPDGEELWYFRKVSADPRAEDYRIFVSRRGPAGGPPLAG